ncbi:MAG: TROVE domain-containing protein [Gemmatimonadetes bacterium]|nr:MAG: TROVE domain-containing protein [Gemmatimonadota bacterium]
MAKLGFFTQRPHPDQTRNKEGGMAFQIPDPALRLLSMLGSSFFNEPKYYELTVAGDLSESAGLIISTAQEIAQSEHPRDLLLLAHWARSAMRIRTTPQILLAIAANDEKTKPFVRQYCPRIIQRADEVRQVFAAYDFLFGRPFPNCLKRGLADALTQFDEYALLKYNTKRHPTFRDVLLMIDRRQDYPVQQALFEYLVNQKVIEPEKTPVLAAQKALLDKTEFDDDAKRLATTARATWEMLVSHFGNRTEVWEFLIPQMGYMALLRNLRNLQQAGISWEATERVARRLADPEEVARSKQLPFRFYTAYLTVQGDEFGFAFSYRFMEALIEALEHSLAQVPHLPGKTAICCDNSGSMAQKISRKSEVSCADVANLLGAMAHRICDEALVIAFATDAVTVDLPASDDLIAKAEAIKMTETNGWATHGWKCIQLLIDQNIFVDRILLLSDMQCYDSHWERENSVNARLNAYRRRINSECYLHSIDLQGYGLSQTPTDDPRVNLLSGFSENILSYILTFEAATPPDTPLPTLETLRQQW